MKPPDALFTLTRAAMHNIRFISTSSKACPSPVQWISPLQLHKNQKLDPPVEVTESNLPRRQRFITHDLAIRLIKREKDAERALEVFNKASDQRGFTHNNATYGIILDKLAQCREFHALDALLHRMTYETCKFHEGIFINLMNVFSKYSMHEKVVAMFNSIQPIVREKPSLKAVSTCLNLLVEAKEIDLARNFLLETQKNLHLVPNTCIFNILVKHHCRNGNLESVIEMVKEMKTSEITYPNLITYSTLIDGFCKCGRLQEAMDLFEEMISKEQILPDVLTYNLLINGFCKGGKVDRAGKIIEFMKKNGTSPNIYNYSALMNGLCKEGRLEDAKEILNEMKEARLKPDKVCYTTLINYLCRADAVDEAIEFLYEMKEVDCKPDEVTFNVILRGLCRQGRFDEALRMVERLPYRGVYLKKGKLQNRVEFLVQGSGFRQGNRIVGSDAGKGYRATYATSNELIVCLCQKGKVANAAMVLFGLAEMGFKPEPHTWSTLIDVMCRERKLLRAFELIDELVTIE